MPVRRYLVPFAAGVAVGIAVHKYWPKIRAAAGHTLADDLAREHLGRLLERARTTLREQRERFSDLVAEIREEEAMARRGPPAGPRVEERSP